ncbi:MAG: hypothetical protein ACPGC3_04205 [Paracoccaceae bacterium]
MGGGGGGDTVTNVTNTGLGDDQYQSLYDNQGTIKENQGNIASSLDAQREEAATAYDTMYGRLDTQDTDLSNILAGIGVAGRKTSTGRTDPTGLYAQFANTNKNLTDSFGNVTSQFGDLTRDLGQQSTNIQSTIGSRIDTLDDDMIGRFDDVDSGISGVSDQVTDVQRTADDIDNNTQDLGGDLDALSAASAGRFDDVDDAIGDGFWCMGFCRTCTGSFGRTNTK